MRRVRARRELEWLQLEVSKEAGGERAEEGGRCVRREREPKCEAGGVRGGGLHSPAAATAAGRTMTWSPRAPARLGGQTAGVCPAGCLR